MALKQQVPNVYGVGLNNVGSYLAAGQPYLSGSTTGPDIGSVIFSTFSFPYVSKRVIITNNDAANSAMVSFAPFLDAEASDHGFTNSASGSGNWLYLAAGASLDLDVKCKTVFVSPADATVVNDVTVYAELTNIPVRRLYSFDGLEGVS